MALSVALVFVCFACATNVANGISNTECLRLWNCQWKEKSDPFANNKGNCAFWDPEDPFFRPSSPPPPGPLDIKARCSSLNVASPWLPLSAPRSTLTCLGLITNISSAALLKLSLYDCDKLEIHDTDLNVFPFLEELIIRYGAVKYISPTAFCHAENLKVIDFFQDADGTGIFRYPEALTGNKCGASSLIHNSTSETKFLPSVTELSFSNFQFNSTISEHAFHKIKHLRTLRFDWAVFSTDEDFQSFKLLKQLEFLQLSINLLDFLDVQSFLSNVLPLLSNLETLWVTDTNLTRLVPSFFPNNLMVEHLRFPFNQLSLVDAGTFKNLQRLRSLDLAVNQELGLNISQDFFKGTFNLESLNISECSFTSFNHINFSDTIHLKSFIASGNLVGEIPDLFTNFVGDETVLRDIKSIDLSRNEIIKINSFTFSNLPRLVEIDLSSNYIYIIENKAFYNLERIERINLRKNILVTVFKDSLFDIPSLDFLDLSQNFLTSFPKFPCHVNWKLGPDGLPRKRFLTDLRANNLQCDCKMHELFFRSFISIEDCPFENFEVGDTWPGKYELVNQRFHRDELRCSSRTNYLIDDILDEPGAFFTDLNQADWFHCPLMCVCFLQCETNMNVTFCKNNLTEIPQDLDESTNYLYLLGNRINNLTKSSLANLHNLVLLNLRDNQIDFVENGVFQTLPFLRYVDLSNNKLREVQEGTFKSNSNSVTNLDLSGNVISQLHPKSFDSLTKLKSLDISQNEIRVIPQGLLDNLTSISTFFVSENPLNCSCDMLYLSNWYKGAIFETNRTKLTTDVKDIDCTPFTNDSVLLDWIEEQERICNPIPTVRETENMTTVKVLTSVVIVMAIVCASALFIFKYHLEIRVIIYAKTGIRWFIPTNEDKEKEYDAFVSFSNHDDGFVLNELLPRLENRQPAQWKICIHQRDFAVGESIATNIVNAIDKSRRVIIVLSNEFLQSDWCSYEFRTAHSQALRERARRIILIMMKDVNIDKLDKELKAYISTNTYLKADDKLFWSKLEYALPEPRKCFNQNEGETQL